MSGLDQSNKHSPSQAARTQGTKSQGWSEYLSHLSGRSRCKNLFRHGEIGVTVRKTHEGMAAGIQPRSCINKDAYRLVLLQLRSQPDNQSTPWNVLGYWVNRDAAVCVLMERQTDVRHGHELR